MQTAVQNTLQFPMRVLAFLKKDGRHHQIFYLSIFLTYGLLFLEWEGEYWNYGLAIGACLVVQAIGLSATKQSWSGLKSAMISALSLCLMFKFTEPTTILLAASLTIGSKFLIRYNNKHIFNPTNFGIIVTMLILGDGWISPGQWGSQALLLFFFGITGFFVLFKVGRIGTGLTFLLTFAALQLFRDCLYLGWPLDFWLHNLTSGTLLLFAFFMITDPKTTPNHPKARVIWATMIGFLAFFLTSVFHVHSAPVWALFFAAPLTPIFDKLFTNQKFSWK